MRHCCGLKRRRLEYRHWRDIRDLSTRPVCEVHIGSLWATVYNGERGVAFRKTN